MNREDIIRMAREAGLLTEGEAWVSPYQEAMERFATLVAEHTLMNIDPSKFMSWQEGYEAGVTAEREACAKLLEEAAQAAKDVDPQGFVWISIKTSAEGIRERSKHD